MDSARPFDQFKELVQMLKPSAFAATKPQPSPHTNIPHQSILINTRAVSSHSVVDSQHTYCLFKHLCRLELHLIETTKLQKGQSFGQPSPGPRMQSLVTHVRFYSFGIPNPLKMGFACHPGHDEAIASWVDWKKSNWGDWAQWGAACKAELHATKSAPDGR